jgi:hypothetical protein
VNTHLFCQIFELLFFLSCVVLVLWNVFHGSYVCTFSLFLLCRSCWVHCRCACICYMVETAVGDGGVEAPCSAQSVGHLRRFILDGVWLNLESNYQDVLSPDSSPLLHSWPMPRKRLEWPWPCHHSTSRRASHTGSERPLKPAVENSTVPTGWDHLASVATDGRPSRRTARSSINSIWHLCPQPSSCRQYRRRNLSTVEIQLCAAL